VQMPADAAKAAGLLFLAVVFQISIMAEVEVLGGHPNLLLVTLVSVALLRGAIFGAVAGFCAGLLADSGVFGTLGFMALLLTLAGYWTGRYGETTGRDRAHAPLRSVIVITILYQFAALTLHFMLGDRAPAREVLVEGLLPTVFLNLLLTVPVYAVCRRLLPPPGWAERAREVRLLG
jgi:rod shape-determining protein MreD